MKDVLIKVRKHDIDAMEKWFTKGVPVWGTNMIKARDNQIKKSTT